MKENKSTKGPQTENHLVVILEDMRAKFQVFDEGLISLRKKTDQMNANLESLRDEVGDVRLRMARVEAKLAKLEESTARIESDIRLIKNDLKAKVSFEEFKVLEKRLAAATS
ncbi:MAG: hypothetical protein HYS07_07040 [Chlamydiae bacterium]|nr:hypothetical protein [Chlamydiota bacterium]MBI3277537.1 hypothetical protein [Chlamydiota bacterium]